MLENQLARKITLFVLASGMLVEIGCSRAESAPAAATSSKAATASATVSIVHPERKTLKRVVEQPGSIHAYEETAIFARVPGYVHLSLDKDGRIVHDIGQTIRGPQYDSSGDKVVVPGEVLAELVVPELEQQVKLKQAMIRQAEADVDQSRQAVSASDANIATAEAAIAEAKALRDRWESESKRFAGLAKTGTIDEQSRDETLNQFKAAEAKMHSTEAAVRKAKSDRDKAMADVQSAKAHADVARADASAAEAMLGYAEIRAPYDGVITSRKVNTGDFVQPAGGQGDWLFKVARLDPVRVVVAVPEADADLVVKNSDVKLTVQASSGPVLSGVVARTSWALETGSRTLRTEIDLPNHDGSLRPGMYVYAQIINPLPEGWTLPISALVKQGDSLACFLIDGNKAVRTQVRVGRGDGQSVTVLQWQKPSSPSSWEQFTGSQIVVARPTGLTDGQTVTLESSTGN